MLGDQLGQLPRDPLGGQLADLVERRALDQADEPLLRELVPRAVEARESGPRMGWHPAPDRTRANGGRGPFSEKIAPVSDLISIDEARGRVLDAVTPLGDEDVPLDVRARPSPRRGRDQPDRRAALRQLGDGRLRGGGGRGGGARGGGRGAGGAPASRARLRPGTAVRISTGAVVPEGADAVVPVERTTAVKGGDPGDQCSLDPNMPAKRALVGCGCRSRAGREYPPSGRGHPPRCCRSASGRRAWARPSWASRRRSGSASVRCARQAPRRRPPHRRRAHPARRAASRPAASTARTGSRSPRRSSGPARRSSARTTVPDDPEGTRAAIAAALEDADVVVVSGGVSVGPARPREGRLRRARRRGALLGRAASAPASRPGSAPATVRSRSACPATPYRRW